MLKGVTAAAGFVAKHYKTIKNAITKATQKKANPPKENKPKEIDQGKAEAKQEPPKEATPPKKDILKRELDRQPDITRNLGKQVKKGSVTEASDSWVGSSPDTPNTGNTSDATPNRQRSLSLDDKGGPSL